MKITNTLLAVAAFLTPSVSFAEDVDHNTQMYCEFFVRLHHGQTREEVEDVMGIRSGLC